MDPVHVPAYRTHYRHYIIHYGHLEYERATVVCKGVISCRYRNRNWNEGYNAVADGPAARLNVISVT